MLLRQARFLVFCSVFRTMAVRGVARCRSLFLVLDVTRVCQPTRILTSNKHEKVLRIRQSRSIWTGRHCVRWSAASSANPPPLSNPVPAQELEAASHRIEPQLKTNEVSIEYYRGLPQITVPLPSRKERCRFTLRPVSHTVGHFLTMLKSEDRGIDHVSVTTTAGVRIASSNTIEALMEDDFRLTINDVCYVVNTPTQEKLTKEEIQRLSDVKNLVNQLYEALNVEEHQLKKERELCSQLEALKEELEPLEKKKDKLHHQTERHTNTLTWVGLGLMSVQFGILARLTWWEYSWDIMEPVTYFVTYGTAMAAYAYYVLTKQEYVLPEVKDRQYLLTMHKKAKKLGLDLSRYNDLKDQIHYLERDLTRLRDPLQVHLPPHHLAESTKKTTNPFTRALTNMFRSTKSASSKEGGGESS